LRFPHDGRAGGPRRRHCRQRRTYAGQRRLQAFLRNVSVGLDAVDLAILFGNLPHNGKQMLLRMRQQHRILIGLRRFFAFQPLEIRMFERDVQRPQAVRPLGVAGWRDVLQEDRMFV
jgi:hypothetical protein